MRKVLFVLALLSMVCGASYAGVDNGVLMTHRIASWTYTTDPGTDATYCDVFDGDPLTDFADQVTEEYFTVTGTSHFFVVAGFDVSSDFCGVQFGLDTYDNVICSITGYEACGTNTNAIAGAGWPAPGVGIGITVPSADAWSGQFVPVYFFQIYCYPAPTYTTVVPLRTDPTGDFAGFATCDTPPVKHAAVDLGEYGINEGGTPVEPGATGAACCVGDACTVVADVAACDLLGGVFYAAITTCTPNPCPAACCFGDGSCTDVSAADCLTAGGTFHAEWATCAVAQCPQPTGACCAEDGSCTVTEAAGCVSPSVWQGPGTSCTPNDCPQPPAACCFPDGSCVDLVEAQCGTLGGVFHPEWVDCTVAQCPMPTGACCIGHDCFDDYLEADCTAAAGDAWFDGVTCVPTTCEAYTPADGASWSSIKSLYR